MVRAHEKMKTESGRWKYKLRAPANHGSQGGCAGLLAKRESNQPTDTVIWDFWPPEL